MVFQPPGTMFPNYDANSSEVRLWGSTFAVRSNNFSMSHRPSTRQISSKRSHDRPRSAHVGTQKYPSRYGHHRIHGGVWNKAIRPFDKPVEVHHDATQANPSSISKQQLSTLRNSAAFTIGRSTRTDWESVGFNGRVKMKSDNGSSPQFSSFGLLMPRW